MVDNLLAVVPTEKQKDEKIAENIVNELERNDAVNAEDIDVNVITGVVTLSGTADDWQEKNEAFYAAMNTGGVKEVNINIVVIY